MVKNLGRTDTQIDTQINSGVCRLATASKNLATLGGGLGYNPVLWWETTKKQDKKNSVTYLKPTGL